MATAVHEKIANNALQGGEQFYRRVTMGGKSYLVVHVQDGKLSKLSGDIDNAKLQNYADAFFSAHQSNSGADLSRKEITHIDSKGIHLKDGSTQENAAAKLTNREIDLLKDGSIDTSSDARNYDNCRNARGLINRSTIPPQYHSHLPPHKRQFTPREVQIAITLHAMGPLEPILNIWFESEPESKQEILASVNGIIGNDAPLDDKIKAIQDLLKQRVSAENVYNVMQSIMQPALPEGMHFIPDPTISRPREFVMMREPPSRSHRTEESYTTPPSYSSREGQTLRQRNVGGRTVPHDPSLTRTHTPIPRRRGKVKDD